MKHAAKHTAATTTTPHTASAIVGTADAREEKDPKDMATGAAAILKPIKQKQLNYFSISNIIVYTTKIKHLIASTVASVP